MKLSNIFYYDILTQDWINDPHVRANSRSSKITNPEEYFFSNITRDQFERLVEFYEEVSKIQNFVNMASQACMYRGSTMA